MNALIEGNSMDNDEVFTLSLDLAQQLLPNCQTKHQQDEAKFQRFFEAYQNNQLDLLFK